MPAARATQVQDGTADETLVGGASLLHGWTFREVTGTDPATVELIDGSSPDGQLVVTISLKAGQSTRDPFPGAGIGIYTNLYLAVLEGEIRGAVWTTPATIIDGYAVTEGLHPAWSGNE